ncbi:MAG: site-specific integrase [Deltaproteobacteria bacterium]|nr:site-specific integrase [Deltaproteobacteria bacterium]
MPGQIVKRGKRTWVVRVFLGRENGRRRYLNKTVHGTHKNAEQTLNNSLRERDIGALVEPTRITLSEYMEQWLASAAKPRVRLRTYQGYEELFTRYLKPMLGPRQLSRLTPLEIQAVYGRMSERGLSARTVRHAHGVLRSALNQAVKWRMLSINPALAVELPRWRRKEMQCLTPEQAGTFLMHATPNRLSTMFAVAISTGMRPGEYMGLKWTDIDLEKGMVVVRRTLVLEKGGGRHFAEPKTDHGRRTIPLPASVTRALIEHRRAQAAEKLKAGASYENQDLVFATPTGEPLNLRNVVNRHFKPILEAAKLPKSIRLYDLRHTCATLLLAQGEHPKVVSERLGHANITLTLDTYSHVLPTMQQHAAESLEAVLFGSNGKGGT